MIRLPATEKTIAKVQKKKELSEKEAIEYMLNVATGRLTALWRYDDSLPEGKRTKGVLTTVGRKKRADRSKAIKAAPVERDAAKVVKAPKPRKRKPKAKPEQTEQAEVAQ